MCHSDRPVPSNSNFNFNSSLGAFSYQVATQFKSEISFCCNADKFIYVLKYRLSLFLELLEFTEDRNPWESVEQRLKEIR